MTRKKKFILAGIAAAAVGLTAASAIADRGHHWRGHHKGHHFGHMGGAGFLDGAFSGHGRFCRGNSAEHADIMLVRLEHRLKLTDDQKEAFDAFKTATRETVAKLSEDCPEKGRRGDRASADEDKKEEAKERTRPTPLERLAKRQERLETSLEALKVYRPAAEAFYAKLTDDQKKTLSERKGKRHGWHRGRHHDRWEGRGPRHERGEHRRDRDREDTIEREADDAPAHDDGN